MGYRRIKWVSMESVPGKRIDNILEVRFSDRWANEYRWSPKLEEVSTLFSEVLRMELTRKESLWRNLARDLITFTVLRNSLGEGIPEYPELIKDLMDAEYLGSYIAEGLPGTEGICQERGL